jgi:hypothetical protein
MILMIDLGQPKVREFDSKNGNGISQTQEKSNSADAKTHAADSTLPALICVS